MGRFNHCTQHILNHYWSIAHHTIKSNRLSRHIM